MGSLLDSANMLLKPFQNVVLPRVEGRAGQTYSKQCPYQGGGSSGGSTPPDPGHRCVSVPIYGPPSPIDGGLTIIGYTTICI